LQKSEVKYLIGNSKQKRSFGTSKRKRSSGLGLAGPEQGPITGFCEYVNELLGSLKTENILTG
jgi:hypothetical protein